MAEPTAEAKWERNIAIAHAGFLLGMSMNDRHIFTDFDREALRGISAFLYGMAGRPDLMPPGPPSTHEDRELDHG